MKPFDLEKALAGEPVVTRGGIPVTEIYYFKTARINFPVRAVVNGEVVSYTNNGSWGLKNTDNYDLCMAPVKKQEWCNIYLRREKLNGYSIGVDIYPTKEAGANIGKISNHYVTTVLIREWEE